MISQTILEVKTFGRGLYVITDQIVKSLVLPPIGMLNCFIQHTSCSLLIQENYDPTAKADIEEFLCRLAPDSDTWYTHDAEGPDDSTSHLKSSIMPTSLNIPIVNGALGLGRWQGIYLFEHRIQTHRRNVVLTVNS